MGQLLPFYTEIPVLPMGAPPLHHMSHLQRRSPDDLGLREQGRTCTMDALCQFTLQEGTDPPYTVKDLVNFSEDLSFSTH